MNAFQDCKRSIRIRYRAQSAVVSSDGSTSHDGRVEDLNSNASQLQPMDIERCISSPPPQRSIVRALRFPLQYLLNLLLNSDLAVPLPLEPLHHIFFRRCEASTIARFAFHDFRDQFLRRQGEASMWIFCVCRPTGRCRCELHGIVCGRREEDLSDLIVTDILQRRGRPCCAIFLLLFQQVCHASHEVGRDIRILQSEISLARMRGLGYTHAAGSSDLHIEIEDLVDVELGTLPDALKRHFDARRTSLLDSLPCLLCPCLEISRTVALRLLQLLQSSDDLLRPIRREASIYRQPLRSNQVIPRFFCCSGIAYDFLDAGINLLETSTASAICVCGEGKRGQALFQSFQAVRRNVMRCDAGEEDAIPSQTFAGEAKIGPNLAVQPGKEEIGTHVREQADICLRKASGSASYVETPLCIHLRHGKDGLFGCDAERRMYGKTDTSAHYFPKISASCLAPLAARRTCCTVHECDYWLLHVRNIAIALVLLLEEVDSLTSRFWIPCILSQS